MSKVQIKLPPKLVPVFSAQDVRYRQSWGGRGSGKTRSFAKMTAVKGYMFAEMGVSGTLLCGREFMNTLADSSMEEIKQAIREEPFLNNYYEMGENYIRTKNKRVTYSFCGLRHNLDSIKSKARILLSWVDEAETVSEMAWRKLLPTVREEIVLPNGKIVYSEVWVTWNPERRDSPTSTRFRHEEILDDEGVLIGIGAEMNYSDNPWFPHVLDLERRRDQANLDDVTYRWIWEGAYLEMSEAQIFKGKYEKKDFTPDPQKWHGPYIGLDFGFAQDPTACVKVWIHDDCLWIEHEGGKVGLELDDTVEFLEKKIPDIRKYAVYADSARPESISHLKKKGLRRIAPVEKGKGSVEDGIEFIKSFKKVYIHSRCKETLKEFRDYSYKKDRLTDEVLPIIIDKDNHYIDACIEHGQLVSTLRGDIPIQEVRRGDMVLTRNGYRRVNHAWKTSDDATIWIVKTMNGLELRATDNHLVYTKNGFTRVDALRYNDEIVTLHQGVDECEIQKKLSMMVSLGLDTQNLKEGVIENILKNLNRMAAQNICTDIYGKNTMAKSQKDFMFTTLMKIARTMSYQTLPLCTAQYIGLCTQESGLRTIKKSSLTTWTKSDTCLKNGTQVKKAERNTEKSERRHTKNLSQQESRASNAIKNFCQKQLVIEMNFAQILASLSIEDLAELTTLTSSASIAPLYLGQTNTPRGKLVEDRVLTVYATKEKNKVYDLEVDGEHEFFASNILVHNCRYAIEKVMKRGMGLKINMADIESAFGR